MEMKDVDADEPSERAANRLFKNFIGDDGRVYACSGRNFFAFESNGSIAWMVHLRYTCNANIAPVHGYECSVYGITNICKANYWQIYLVAENRVLKIYPLRIGTSEPALEVFFGPGQGTEEPGEIIGISASIFSSCVIINLKNQGLFAYRLYGQLMWTAGPVLNQHGYLQGCTYNITECHFTSVPVIDHCEASIYISNTVGELYSLSIRGPYFKWIQDIRSFGNTFTITPGNNGRLYVTIPDAALVLALDVSTGHIFVQGSIGPLSSSDYEPVVDANGWISIGSLDGFFYSFSPIGAPRKFPKSASLDSVIQVNPVLDCSGYAVYISQTEMEGKISQTIAEYTYVSALKPKNVAFTLLVPASGSTYWSGIDPGNFLLKLSQSDLQHFVLDERTLLAFFAASSKLVSFTSVPCSNERAIILFLLIESVVLVFLGAVVRYCCIFWKKKKLQGLSLGKFLEKRRSLRSQKKAFDRMITELERKASEEAVANEVLETLSDLVKEREDIKRKLSTTYSLGRDGEKSRSKSLLPLRGDKSRSYSFQGSKNESVTIFHTLSETTSSGGYSSPIEEADNNLSAKEESVADAKAKEKGKGKAPVEVESSSDDEIHENEYVADGASASQPLVHPLYLEHSCSGMEEVKVNDDDDDVKVMGHTDSESGRLAEIRISLSSSISNLGASAELSGLSALLCSLLKSLPDSQFRCIQLIDGKMPPFSSYPEELIHAMGTEDLIKLPASSNSEHGSENDDQYESGCEAIKSGSTILNSKALDEINGDATGTMLDGVHENIGTSAMTDCQKDVGNSTPVLPIGFELTESVAVVDKVSVSSVHVENGSLAVKSEISLSNHKNDETTLALSGVKRPRIAVDEQQPSVHVIYNSLPADVQLYQTQDSNLVLESGEETYFPALRVGLDKPSAVSFWVDNRTTVQSSKEFIPLDGTSVPLYDRGYSSALTSVDGSSGLDGGVEKLDTSRCFNCGSYSHALKDCPKPRDNVAVNNARKQHKSRRNQHVNSRNSTRYYQSSRGGKYDGLIPGVLDAETRKLLGLGELDPPPWLNRMREIGYPPGYLDPDVEDQPSGITIFGDETNHEEGEEGEILDSYTEPPRKMTVEFPGINAPIPENADERLWAPVSSTINPSSDHPHHRDNHSSEHLRGHYYTEQRNNHPSENLSRGHYYTEKRWFGEMEDDGPPGCEPGTSPSLSNHFRRHGDYESSHHSQSPRTSQSAPWSPSIGRSFSDRGRRSPLVQDRYGSSNYGHYGTFPYSSPR
ncbi:UNVERIFIED_CONTAM: protein GAMETE EXPRESSED 3 [Sesamum calycinum]|uniref:Protein GAMETE EXPRESSED 3 n=1 Tax=Sesamum calycinum TaxID=2727403 RepID=A0AAW2MNA2_9LAMI